MKVLITGGAGFIGSHIADGLIEKGHKVRIFDILHPQVHGEKRRIPDYLNPKAEFILGDVCDYNALKKAVAGMDAIYHEAAAVGVGPVMPLKRTTILPICSPLVAHSGRIVRLLT